MVFIVLSLAFVDILLLLWFVFDQFMIKKRMDRRRKEAYRKVILSGKMAKNVKKL